MKEPPYKYMVRLPAAMRDLIAESARHYRRSMNSDIVARLQHSFSGLGTDGSGNITITVFDSGGQNPIINGALLTVTDVPEPSTAALFGLAAFALLSRRRN